VVDPVHDDALCAAGNAEDSADRPEMERCLDGEVYGPCGHENCYGICEWLGRCQCRCHGPAEPRSYAAQINAPLQCTTARAIGAQIASGDYPRYKVAKPREITAEKAVFIDGPVAGLLRPIPSDFISYMVDVPRPLCLTFEAADLARPIPRETAYYSLTTVYCDYRGTRIWIRVGVSAGFQPEQEALAEHVPTALAEQGLIPWDAVPDTDADRATPITVMTIGDPLKDCSIKVTDLFYLPADMLQATCACGWATEYDTPMARRAQLVRFAHKHAAGQDRRRELYNRPILVLRKGTGATPTCYAGIRTDKHGGKIYGACRECGFETEAVEDFRRGPLWGLCQPHTGPDGVRKVRNQLLGAWGLPAPTVEEEAALSAIRREREAARDA